MYSKGIMNNRSFIGKKFDSPFEVGYVEYKKKNVISQLICWFRRIVLLEVYGVVWMLPNVSEKKIVECYSKRIRNHSILWKIYNGKRKSHTNSGGQ